MAYPDHIELVRITHAKLRASTPLQTRERLHKRVLLHNLLGNLRDELDRGEHRYDRLDGCSYARPITSHTSRQSTSYKTLPPTGRLSEPEVSGMRTRRIDSMLYEDARDGEIEVSYSNELYDGSVMKEEDLELMDDCMPSPDYFDEGLGGEDTYAYTTTDDYISTHSGMETAVAGDDTHMNNNNEEAHIHQAEIMHLGLGALLDQDDVGDTHISESAQEYDVDNVVDTPTAYSSNIGTVVELFTGDTHMTDVAPEIPDPDTYIGRITTEVMEHDELRDDNNDIQKRLGRVEARASDGGWGEGSTRRPRSKSVPAVSRLLFSATAQPTTSPTRKSNLSQPYRISTQFTDSDPGQSLVSTDEGTTDAIVHHMQVMNDVSSNEGSISDSKGDYQSQQQQPPAAEYTSFKPYDIACSSLEEGFKQLAGRSTSAEVISRTAIGMATPSARVKRLTRPIRTTTQRAKNRLNEWCVRKTCRDSHKVGRNRSSSVDAGLHRNNREVGETIRRSNSSVGAVYKHAQKSILTGSVGTLDVDVDPRTGRDGEEISSGGDIMDRPLIYDRDGVKITSARVCAGATAVALRVVFDTNAQHRAVLNYSQILYT